MIKGVTIEIVEKEQSIEIHQLDSKIKITNINDINILIDLLTSAKHKFLLQRSLNYKDVYYEINEKNRSL